MIDIGISSRRRRAMKYSEIFRTCLILDSARRPVNPLFPICCERYLATYPADLPVLSFHVTIESVWFTMSLSKLFREKGRERVGVPSSSERAPERAATVPTVPRVSRDGASLTRTMGNRTAGRTTLAVIAAEAGASLPTVPQAVTGRPDV